MSYIQDLLSSINITTLIVYIFLFLFAFKGAVEVVEYFYNKLKVLIQKTTESKNSKQEVTDDIKLLEVNIKTINDEINHIEDLVDKLLALRLDDIRSYLKTIHHRYVGLGAIDDITLQNAEEKFQFYVDNGGNGYIKTIFEDIRSLKVVSVAEIERIRNRKEESQYD